MPLRIKETKTIERYCCRQEDLLYINDVSKDEAGPLLICKYCGTLYKWHRLPGELEPGYEPIVIKVNGYRFKGDKSSY